MSSGADQLRGLAGEITWQEALGGLTSRQIAQTFGISRAAAWRAASGRTQNPTFTRRPAFQDFRAAQALRRRAARGPITTQPVKARVRYGRRSEGMRDLPALQLVEPYLIARRMEQGRWNQAEEALSAQLVNAYGDLEMREHLADALEIDDYDGDLFH